MNLKATLLALLMVPAVAAASPFDARLDLPESGQPRRVTRLTGVGPGETAVLMDTKGAGCIRHIWMTTAENDYRRLVLRMYWDGEEDPSVEAPLSDFFGAGHNMRAPEQTLATPCLTVGPKNGYNCYFPMPFGTSARITLTNEQAGPVQGGVYFQADYLEYGALSADVPRFHAQWRREAPALRRARPYTIMQATGSGFIAGMTYHVRADDMADSWYHGGGDMVFLDAQSSPSYLHGIGGEDYFGASWGIAPFQTRYTGCTHHADGLLSMYRFYLEMPLTFTDSARLAFGAMENEITSVGYWYQTEPHQRFFNMPKPEQRAPASRLEPGSQDRELLPGEQVSAAVIGPFKGGLDTELPPDTQILLDEPVKTNYEGPYGADHPGNDDRMVQWRRARTTLNWLDLAALHKPKMAGPTSVQRMPGAAAFVYLRIKAEEWQQCPLLVGHDDPVRVWVNAKHLTDLDAAHGFKGERLTLGLRPGTNDLLLKVTNAYNENWAAHAVSLYFPEREGLEFDDFGGLPESAEYARGAGAPPAQLEGGGIAFEGEALGEVIQTKGAVVAPQRMPEPWSNGAHLLFRFEGKGAMATVEFDLPMDQPATSMEITLTTASNYGVVGIAMDGKLIGEPVDTYNGEGGTENTHCVPLTVTIDGLNLEPGTHQLSFGCLGKNDASQGFLGAIDKVVFRP